MSILLPSDDGYLQQIARSVRESKAFSKNRRQTLNNIKKGPENLYRRVLLPFEGRVAIVRRVSDPLTLFKHFTSDAVPRAPPYFLILNEK